jgi:CheY-like chemotaxis protein
MSTVLVVDDQVSLLHALEESLLEGGYDVKLATSGGGALKRIEPSPPGHLPPAAGQRSGQGHAHGELPGARRSSQPQGGPECDPLTLTDFSGSG